MFPLDAAYCGSQKLRQWHPAYLHNMPIHIATGWKLKHFPNTVLEKRKLPSAVVDEEKGEMINCCWPGCQPGIREDEIVDGLLGTDLQPMWPNQLTHNDRSTNGGIDERQSRRMTHWWLSASRVLSPRISECCALFYSVSQKTPPTFLALSFSVTWTNIFRFQ